MSRINRCAWANTDDRLMQKYHDNEWGRPTHDINKMFELLSLEIMQAGLSWKTILHKRKAFDIAFHGFNPKIVKQMQPELPKLLKNKRIVRNKMKLRAIIHNAGIVYHMNDFSAYMWNFVGNQPIINHYRNWNEVPSYTKLSIKISKRMKADGFKFTGKTIIYSYMQAIGMINDHTMNCFLYKG